MITVYIDDIWKYPSSGSIHIKCSTDTNDTFDLVLDIVKMRIDWNGEFEDELQHDIQKEYTIEKAIHIDERLFDIYSLSHDERKKEFGLIYV